MESVIFRKIKMKISKLEEGIIEMDVIAKPGNNERNYFVTGKFISGKLRGSIAFDDVIPREYSDKDPSFSARDIAAYNFALKLRVENSIYKPFYCNEKIEVIRKMDGNN